MSDPRVMSPLVVSGSSCPVTPTATQAHPASVAAPLVANGSTVQPAATNTAAMPGPNQATSSRDVGKDVANGLRRLNLGPKTPNLVVNGSSSAAIFADRPKSTPRQPSHESPKTDCNSELGTKASSLDGKSIASTNLLDEKESLRPEDSASVMAAAEDDDTSIRGSMIAGSRMGSDLAYRARNITLGDAIVPDRRPVAPAAMLMAGPGIMTPQSASSDQQGTAPTASMGADTLNIYQQHPDDKLLDAMKSPRDRLFLLRLETQLIDFVTNSKEPYMDVREGPDKGPERSLNTFYRMLAHKLADYYHMTHTYEPAAEGVRIYRTPFCRVPQSLAQVVATSTSTGSTPPPTILPKKIMKRGEDMETGQSGSSPSKGTSDVDGESKDKALAKEIRPTRSEREEAYKLARERIFGNTAEPEPNDNDNSESRASSVSAKEKNNGVRRRNMRQRRDSDGFDYRPHSNYWHQYPQQQQQQPPWPPQGQYMPMPNGQFPPQMAPGPYMVPAASLYPQPNPAFSPMMPQGPGPYPGPQYGMGPPPPGPQFPPQPNQQPRYSPVNGGTSPMMGYGTPVPPPGPQVGFQSQPSPVNGAPPYPNRGPGSSPLLMPSGIPYAYGQLPANDSKDPNRQHPIPGSYNRVGGFNPQIKSFVPGGNRMGPGPVPGPNMGSMPPAPPFTAPGSQHSSPHVPPSSLAYGGVYQPSMPPPGPHFPNGPRQGPMNNISGPLHPPHAYQGPPHGAGPQHMHQPPMHHQPHPQQAHPHPHHSHPPPPQLHPSLPPHPPLTAMNHLPPHSPNLPNKPIPQGPAAMVNHLSSYGHPASLPPKPATGT